MNGTILTGSGERVRITVPTRYHAYTANGSKYSYAAAADFLADAGFWGVDLSLDQLEPDGDDALRVRDTEIKRFVPFKKRTSVFVSPYFELSCVDLCKRERFLQKQQGAKAFVYAYFILAGKDRAYISFVKYLFIEA
jgi:hypothetical protein